MFNENNGMCVALNTVPDVGAPSSLWFEYHSFNDGIQTCGLVRTSGNGLLFYGTTTVDPRDFVKIVNVSAFEAWANGSIADTPYIFATPIPGHLIIDSVAATGPATLQINFGTGHGMHSLATAFGQAVTAGAFVNCTSVSEVSDLIVTADMDGLTASGTVWNPVVDAFNVVFAANPAGGGLFIVP